MELKTFSEIPLFMSCTSFEYPDSEFILYTGTPRILFAVNEDEPEDNDLYRHIEHSNGDEDYITVADCFDKAYFDGKPDEQVVEEIAEIMDSLEGWYISEVIDLDSYDE